MDNKALLKNRWLREHLGHKIQYNPEYVLGEGAGCLINFDF